MILIVVKYVKYLQVNFEEIFDEFVRVTKLMNSPLTLLHQINDKVMPIKMIVLLIL